MTVYNEYLEGFIKQIKEEREGKNLLDLQFVQDRLNNFLSILTHEDLKEFYLEFSKIRSTEKKKARVEKNNRDELDICKTIDRSLVLELLKRCVFDFRDITKTMNEIEFYEFVYNYFEFLDNESKAFLSVWCERTINHIYKKRENNKLLEIEKIMEKIYIEILDQLGFGKYKSSL